MLNKQRKIFFWHFIIGTLTLINISSTLFAAKLKNETLKFKARKTEDKANYFCTPEFRGQSDIMSFDQSSLEITLTGNIILQSRSIDIKSNSISLKSNNNNSKEFHVTSNSILNIATQIDIYEINPNKQYWPPCEAGILLERNNIKILQAQSGVVSWIKNKSEQTLELSGNVELIMLKQDTKLKSFSVKLNLDQNSQPANIRIFDNLELVKGDSSVLANLGTFDFKKENLTLIGNVVIKFIGLSLFKTERLDAGFGEEKFFVTKETKNNLFLIR